MRTEKLATIFLDSCRAKNLSPRTIKWYEGILRAFSTRCHGLPQKPSQVEAFLVSCPGKDERRHGYYRTLRAFYHFLERRYRVRNPIKQLDPPRRERKDPRFLMPEDINRLINFAHRPKVEAALTFLTDTGARLGEVATVDLDDFLETPWGFIARIHGKTGMRSVPISYETYHMMLVNLPFGVGVDQLGRWISQAFKDAGVKGSAHTLRHSFATLWQGDELALQAIMGHSNLATTKLYRHLRMQYLSTQHTQFTPLKMVLRTQAAML